LTLLIVALQQWRAAHTLDANFWKGLGWAAGATMLVCLVPYLPFHLSFSSPGQGIGLVLGAANHTAIPLSAPPAVADANPESRTAIVDMIGANGVMLFIFGSWLIVLLAQRLAGILPVLPFLRPITAGAANVARLPDGTLAMTLTESPLSHLHPAPVTQPEAVTPRLTPERHWNAWLVVSGAVTALIFLTKISVAWDGWTFIWSVVLLGVALWLALEPVIFNRAEDVEAHAISFPLLLVALGGALLAVCEVVYLRDVFAGSYPRMNTVFKFYFQVWLLFALASAPALAWLADRVRSAVPTRWRVPMYAGRAAWGVVLVGLVAVTLIYPLGAAHTVYPLDQKHATLTLDGMRGNPYLAPQDVAAMVWLQQHAPADSVVVEGNDKTEYNTVTSRVATYTGLPTLIGWLGHEYQWRVNWLKDPTNAADYGARLNDLATIYTNLDNQVVLRLLRHYHARYLFVGAVEWQTYGGQADLNRFARFLPIVYQSDGATIYAVR
jgi:uncharacterized membrane protein